MTERLDNAYEPADTGAGRDLTQPIDPNDVPAIGDPQETLDDPYEGMPDDGAAGSGSPYKRAQQEIDTSSIGLIYLSASATVDGRKLAWKLPCTACMYSMSMNQIPMASVYVGMGRSLMDPSRDDPGPELLLKALETRDSKELVYNMLYCELYEEKTDKHGWDGPGDLLIFKGYIATASPVYNANAGGSSMQIQFTCYGLAAALMTSPVAAYTETYMGAAMERLRRNSPLDPADARATGDLLNGFRYDVDQLMNTEFMQTARKQPIARRIAICVGAVRMASAWLHTKSDKFKEDDAVTAAIGGTAKLKLNGDSGNGISDECDEAYTRQLLEVFMTRMNQVNIWDTVQSVMTSDMFLMQLMPRWYCDSSSEPDFKMELGPCTAWKPRRKAVELSAGDIVTFQLQHASLGVMNTPDVFFVNFSDMLAYVGGSAKDFSFGILGVAARTEDLQRKLRADCAYADLKKLNEDTLNCRLKEVPAPHWLSCVAPSKGVTDQGSRDNTKSLDVEHTPSKVADESRGPDADDQPSLVKPTPDAPSKATAWDAANAIARSLFLHYYMAGDTVALTLLPDLRFGLRKADGVFLENSIGDTIEVNLTDSVSKSGLKMRGVLQSVTYQYAAGKASTATYTAMLTRVRVSDVDVPDEECPIYTSGDPVK